MSAQLVELFDNLLRLGLKALKDLWVVLIAREKVVCERKRLALVTHKLAQGRSADNSALTLFRGQLLNSLGQRDPESDKTSEVSIQVSTNTAGTYLSMSKMELWQRSCSHWTASAYLLFSTLKVTSKASLRGYPMSVAYSTVCSLNWRMTSS